MANMYNVHIYREMKLRFDGIEADTHETAAGIAREKPTDEANSIEDCEGITLAALVDVVGDEDYGQSRMIDFDEERQRKAAHAMLATLQSLAELRRKWRSQDSDETIDSIEYMDGLDSLDLDSVIAEATAAGLAPSANAAIHPIVTVTVRGGLIEDVDATIPIHAVIADWDVADEDTGKKPARNVWELAGSLPASKADKLRRLIANR